MTGQGGEAALVRTALGGDVRATRELVETLLPTVQARVTHVLHRVRRGGATTDAVDDLTQHVFLALFDDGGRRLRAWDPARGAALATFVSLVAEHEVLALLRRARRNPWTESPTEDAQLALCVGAVADHEAQVASRELLDVVLDQAVAGLDDRGLLLFQRLVVDEAPVDVVAQEVGTTVSALYMWKSRFSKRVRELADEASSDSRRPRLAPPSTQPGWSTR